MPFTSSLRGRVTGGCEQLLDDRRCAAYAAGVGDWNPAYWDNEIRRLVAHPVYPLCLEWPVSTAVRELPVESPVGETERARLVHASQDLHLYSPLASGLRLRTSGTVLGYRKTRRGTAEWLKIDTVDVGSGELICRSYQSVIGIDVEHIGSDGLIEDVPSPPAIDRPVGQLDMWPHSLPAYAPHVYTECSGIYNPIHSDQAVARSAGFAGPLMHGSALLAIATTCLVDHKLKSRPDRVVRVGCRFSSVIIPPADLQIRLLAESDNTLFFDIVAEDDSSALKAGFLVYR